MTSEHIIGLCAGLGISGIIAATRMIFHKKAMQSADSVKKEARLEAETIVKEARLAAKEEQITARDEFEKSTKDRRIEMQKLEERISQREENIERKATMLDERVHEVEKRDNRLREKEEDVDNQNSKLQEMIGKEVVELERIASLTKDEAKSQLMHRLGDQLEAEQGTLIRRFQDETRQRCEREATAIMINSMERYASDCAYERTTSTIPLPSDEMKGRIIGREGRNIRAIEAACGVSVLIDDTPEAVVITCFDPVRREIARIALERLVSDGRIHPTRIEDMVGKVRKEIEADILKTGQEVIEELGITGVKQNLTRLLGRLKYRYSYSQNVLKHSIEVAYFMGAIAAQLHLDEQKAKRAGLFHDIGKAVDHEVEGTHALIGADLLKRAGEKEDVVTAVGAHHEEMEKNSALAILVGICDAISAGRPGARSETTELYLKRLEELESIGSAFDGVESCFAIQSGREVRVIVEAEKVNENRANVLAREIAQQIEKELRYPGHIKVTVIRETRAVDYAK